ncbi:hypothetical protein [Marinobacter sp.]|uniref:hypothetical protein n=1 Tax=Marinobacter sp. TaxID=50741 RepID=UPI00356AFBB4
MKTLTATLFALDQLFHDRVHGSLLPSTRANTSVGRLLGVLPGFGAIFNFLLSNRLPSRKVQCKERKSVVFTNLAIVGVFLIAAQPSAESGKLS